MNKFHLMELILFYLTDFFCSLCLWNKLLGIKDAMSIHSVAQKAALNAICMKNITVLRVIKLLTQLVLFGRR